VHKIYVLLARPLIWTQKENFGCKEKNSDTDEKTQKTSGN
jgi:hypothetical protein